MNKWAKLPACASSSPWAAPSRSGRACGALEVAAEGFLTSGFYA
jgi:hypothetical protein